MRAKSREKLKGHNYTNPGKQKGDQHSGGGGSHGGGGGKHNPFPIHREKGDVRRDTHHD